MKKYCTLFWRFLGFYHTPGMRILHITLIFFSILQFISASETSVKHLDDIGNSTEILFSWYHVIGGMLTATLAFIFVARVLAKRGLRYFFPFTTGGFKNVMEDLRQCVHLRLILPRPAGLRALIHGVGMIILLITSLTGAIWFSGWTPSHPRNLHWLLDIHEAFAILLIYYMIIHAIFALLHFLSWRKRTTS